MIASLRENCETYVEVEEPQGGFFLWVKCKKGKASDLIQATADEGLIFSLGSIFFLDKGIDDNHFRLAFTRPPFEHLDEAGKRLRRAFEKILD